MTTVANVNLSDVIVSLAAAVRDANAALDSDSAGTYAITRFEVETRITAVAKAPETSRVPQPSYGKVGAGLYAINSYERPMVAGLALNHMLLPSLREAVLPSVANASATINVKALMEPVPRAIA